MSTYLNNERSLFFTCSLYRSLSLYSFASAHCAHTQTKLNKLKICIYQTWTDSGNGIAVNNKQTKATTKNRLKWRISHDTKHTVFAAFNWDLCDKRCLRLLFPHSIRACLLRPSFNEPHTHICAICARMARTAKRTLVSWFHVSFIFAYVIDTNKQRRGRNRIIVA